MYKMDYSEYNEQTVVTEEPMQYIERLKADLAMNQSEYHLGTYIIEALTYLKVVK